MNYTKHSWSIGYTGLPSLLLYALSCTFFFPNIGFTAEKPQIKAASTSPQKTFISLGDAVSKAVKLSSQKIAAEADFNAQNNKSWQAWTGIGPKVTADYTDIKFDKKLEKQYGPMTIPVRDDKSRMGSITLAQPIVSLYPLIQYARFESTQTDIKYKVLKIVERETAFGAAEVYRRSQQAEEMHQIAQASIKAAENQSRDAQALYRVGKLTRGDLLKIEMAILDAKAQEAKAEAVKETAFSALCEMVGLTLPCNPKLEVLSRNVNETAVSIPDLGTAVNAAMSKRFEMETANLGIELASFGKQLAYAKFTPQVNAFIKWERNFTTQEDNEKNSRAIGLQATWELWDNGSRFFAVHEAAEQVAKAEALKADQERKIRLEIYQSTAYLKAAQETLSLARGAVSQAEESYRIEQARFKSGATTATELLLSETAQTRARGGLVAALTELDIQHLNLQKAMGHETPNLAIPSK